jgi:Fur family transcriptional regulator, ferric uptake regulator
VRMVGVVEWDARLRELGQRSTPARRAVLEVLGSTSDHLSADEIAVAVSERAPDVHRATVFRTLERLVSLGVVTHVHLPHGAATYHVGGSGDRMHLHLSCRGCGGVFDTEAGLLDDVAARVAGTLGFVLDPDHTALSGWCSSCAAHRGGAGGPEGAG